MQYTDLTEISSKEVLPGFHGKFVHSENMTTAYWDIVAGSEIPEHSHEQEQIVNLIEGEFELIVDGELIKLYSEGVVVIPSNVKHSGKAVSHCKLIDIFHPAREDFKF
ncbi:MAG: cupin domain-containing protein [Bacteroidales bacterium]|nr:cupin domain-containing protein [Bacteroidales bacterium]